MTHLNRKVRVPKHFLNWPLIFVTSSVFKRTQSGAAVANEVVIHPGSTSLSLLGQEPEQLMYICSVDGLPFGGTGPSGSKPFIPLIVTYPIHHYRNRWLSQRQVFLRYVHSSKVFSWCTILVYNLDSCPKRLFTDFTIQDWLDYWVALPTLHCELFYTISRGKHGLKYLMTDRSGLTKALLDSLNLFRLDLQVHPGLVLWMVQLKNGGGNGSFWLSPPQLLVD